MWVSGGNEKTGLEGMGLRTNQEVQGSLLNGLMYTQGAPLRLSGTCRAFTMACICLGAETKGRLSSRPSHMDQFSVLNLEMRVVVSVLC